MITMLKSLFIDKCPVCAERLIAETDAACCTKACPDGHYKEESYCALGVRVVYDGLK
ncbi:uncharacterized protein YcgI (DUF1989 family) [Paenibacillus rhizosphaerae]|uniref:Uncharacterized protein YcgI (DUF1989 family) n=1 Tax=Paenibacillus rhizosphaerae TaxID=297318 RepID=A0A839TP62_9BACL|nr:hypothetical protein [Paenibacillus rhizosphaerae]MBB3128555.1 uncharacterized protein YcgI (DUF1989 family) [Paenibacillus rhizosphaerae]